MLNRIKVVSWALGLLCLATGCSVLVNPDLSQLPQPGDASSSADVIDVVDVSRPDAPVNDVTRPDVPMPTDVRPDAPAMCPASCDDGIPCTMDLCSMTTRQCVHMPNNSRCPMNYVCDPTTGCTRRG